MQHEVVFAGFGGQGIMLAGQILAYSAMEEGFNVVWLPSYGPEMRGGTANCSVVISDRPVASPIVPRPGTAVVMNNPSMERFGPAVKPGGCLLVNSSLVNLKCDRSDVKTILIPANQMAIDLGSGKAANMIVLGAYVGATGAVSFDVLTSFVRKKFASKPQFVELNVKALTAGRDLAAAAVRGGN